MKRPPGYTPLRPPRWPRQAPNRRVSRMSPAATPAHPVPPPSVSDGTGPSLDGDDPVIGSLSWHERGIIGRMHSHPRAQLVQALAAPAEIRCARRAWAIGPGEAVWLPGG